MRMKKRNEFKTNACGNGRTTLANNIFIHGKRFTLTMTLIKKYKVFINSVEIFSHLAKLKYDDNSTSWFVCNHRHCGSL